MHLLVNVKLPGQTSQSFFFFQSTFKTRIEEGSTPEPENRREKLL